VRQIVAGIRKAYTPQQLINRRIILVANMDPAVIRGEASNGMLLAASDANGMALLAPDKEMALGSIVK
jgi:methionyl-tRNA synthetase